MKLCLAVLVVAFLGATCFARNYDSSQCTEYPCLVFEDNFDWFDFETWEHEITAGGGGNYEFQYYLNNRSNSFVKDGVMHLRPTLSEERFGNNWVYTGKLDLWGAQPADVCTGNQWNGCLREALQGGNIVNPIQSARIRSPKSFAYRYGRLEIEAKIPKGDWIWPAIWLLPKHQKYGSWPTSGEIDLMESRGNRDLTDQGKQIGCALVGSSIHFGPSGSENGFPTSINNKTLTNGQTFADAFHRYAFDWDEFGMKFYYDGEILLKVETGDGYWKRGGWTDRWGPETNPWALGNKDAPFDQEFHLLINAAVGGTGGFFPDTVKNAGYPKPWSNDSPTAMRQFWEKRGLWEPTWPKDDSRDLQINYIRLYKLKQDCWLTKPPTCHL